MIYLFERGIIEKEIQKKGGLKKAVFEMFKKLRSANQDRKKPRAVAFVDFEHEFRSAGINQVLHRVVVNIKINGSLIVAGYKRTISTKTSAIASQTVIVGKIPQNFTNVIEEESDNTAGLINDYGAVGE